jgi:hypothetical protein
MQCALIRYLVVQMGIIIYLMTNDNERNKK